MLEIFIKLLPLFILIAIGYSFKRLKLLTEKDSKTLIDLVFLLTLPVTVFLAVSKAPLQSQLFIIVLSPIIILPALYLISKPIFDKLKIIDKKKKVMLCGVVMLNTGFIGIPLFGSLFGSEGIAYMSLYDLGSVMILYTLGHYVASSKGLFFENIKDMLFTPVLWAVFLGLIANFYSFQFEGAVGEALSYLNMATIPMIMIAIGAILHLKISQKTNVLLSVFMRVVGGLAVALIFVTLLDLQGMIRTTIVLASTIPSAIMTIVYASREKLDTELAIEIVSLCTLVSLLFSWLVVSFL